MDKKKFHGGLKLFLVALFIMLLGMFSTCYAYNFMTSDDADYIFDYVLTNKYREELSRLNVFSPIYSISGYSPSGTQTLSKSQFASTFSSYKNVFLNAFNTYYNGSLPIDAFIFIVTTNSKMSFSSSNTLRIYCLPCMNGGFYEKNLPYIGAYIRNQFDSYNLYSLQISFIEAKYNGEGGMRLSTADERNSYFGRPLLITITQNGTSSTSELGYNDLWFASVGESSYKGFVHSMDYLEWYYTLNNIVFPVYSVNNTLFSTQNISNGVGYSSLPYLYPYPIYSWNDSHTPPVGPDEPDNPTGGNTGVITNPSGEVTGSIDLSNIESGIGNINENLEKIDEKIPTSGDIKEATTSGVVEGNTQFWGSSGDLTGDEQISDFEDNFLDIQSDLEDTLSDNPVFGVLEDYEDRLFGLFTGEDDWKLEWDSVSLFGGEIIPSGEVNFTQMCEDIEVLGYLKSLINIITSFCVSILLIHQIYNLILSTLGIDNPYLYEESGMEIDTMVDMDSGYTTTTYSGTSVDGSNYHVKYNHTQVKPHRKIGF